MRLMRLEVAIAIGLATWVLSLEVRADSISPFNIDSTYFGTWVFEDETRKEKFILTFEGGMYTKEKVVAFAGRRLPDVQKPAAIKVRGRSGTIQFMTRTGIVLMVGILSDDGKMSGAFANGDKFTAKKYSAGQAPPIWHLVNLDNKRKNCGGFFDRKPVGTCLISNGLGSRNTHNILWSFPSTYDSEADCNRAAILYWEEVCPIE